jgi:hypothetical protein
VRLFASKQAQLGGRYFGFANFRDWLYHYVGQLPAVLPDDCHYTFFGYKEFVPGKNFQGVVKAQALYFRPIIVTAQQLFVSKTD